MAGPDLTAAQKIRMEALHQAVVSTYDPKAQTLASGTIIERAKKFETYITTGR